MTAVNDTPVVENSIPDFIGEESIYEAQVVDPEFPTFSYNLVENSIFNDVDVNDD